MLGAAVDVFGLRQYFNVITPARKVRGALAEDRRLLAGARRSVVRLPGERARAAPEDPFPLTPRAPALVLRHCRVGLIATGGDGRAGQRERSRHA